MEFALIGISYEKSPLSIRERFTFSDMKKMKLQEELSDLGVHQSMMLSTCNRSEIYICFETQKQLTELPYFFQRECMETDINDYLYIKKGHDAYLHLFYVCAGYLSLVIGEDQILGQVVQAYEYSSRLGFCGKQLHKIMREAITCAKKVKTIYRMSEQALSISYIAIQKLKEHGSFNKKRILILGSGSMAELALTYIMEGQPKQVFVCNRSKVHAMHLQKRYPGIEILNFDQRYEALENSDVVISATASPHTILKKECIIRLSQEMIMFDLAVPRDIDPDIQLFKNVILYDMDSLKEISKDHLQQRKKLMKQGEAVILSYVTELEAWMVSSSIDHALASLQSRCTMICEDAVSILDQKLTLSTRERMIVKKTLDHSLYRLIKEPMLELKRIGKENQKEYLNMMEILFQMEGE